MKQLRISYRRTRKGDWLVCCAVPATYGPGVYPTGSPAPGYTTGEHYGHFPTEAEAAAHAQQVAADEGGVVVEWEYPAKNPKFVDLPRQYPDPEETEYATAGDAATAGWIQINPSKTIHHYRGHVIYVRDVTPGHSFGYNLAVALKGHDRLFATSRELWLSKEPRVTGGEGCFTIRFRTGDVVDAIEAACRFVDSLEAA